MILIWPGVNFDVEYRSKRIMIHSKVPSKRWTLGGIWIHLEFFSQFFLIKRINIVIVPIKNDFVHSYNFCLNNYKFLPYISNFIDSSHCISKAKEWLTQAILIFITYNSSNKKSSVSNRDFYFMYFESFNVSFYNFNQS